MQVGRITQTLIVTGHKAAEPGQAPPHPATPERIRVGGDVEAAKAIFQPQPVYPASAEKQGIEGTVVLQAVIGKDGKIMSITSLSGPDQALIQATMNAVSQWRYEPTLLNGAPVEVATTIEVVFKLDNQSTSAQETSLPRAVVHTQTEQNVPPRSASSAKRAGGKVTGQNKKEIVETVLFRGNRHIPSSMLQGRIATRPGDINDVNKIQRDFAALWKTGYFDDIRVSAANGETGKIITFELREKMLIKSIDYEGLSSVSQSELMRRLQQDKVGLNILSQYDPVVAHRAATVLKEMLSENGHPHATVLVRARDIPPDFMAVTFVVVEGPRVKPG
jgi:TonB family protein